MASKKTILITGCSKGGLGDALARAFHSHGLRVIATARNPSKIAHFKALGIETLLLDVLSAASIQQCVEKVSEMTEGSLDILLNNSGAGFHMPLTDVSIEGARENFDLNVWAVLSVTQAFLPLVMKSVHGGMIVNNTSVASIAGVPMQGVYNASKAAAASLSETLRLELAPFGIKVIDMKTGAVKSEFFTNMKDENGSSAKLPEGSIYTPAKKEIELSLSGANVESRMVDADVWAKKVVRDLTKRSPPSTVWRGGSASLVRIGKMLFPSWLWDKLLSEAGGMDILAEKLKEQASRKV